MAERVLRDLVLLTPESYLAQEDLLTSVEEVPSTPPPWSLMSEGLAWGTGSILAPEERSGPLYREVLVGWTHRLDIPS